MPNMRENSAGGVVGFQVPNSIKRRKGKLDELLRLHEDISMSNLLGFVSTLDEAGGEVFGSALDEEMYDEAADCVRESFVRNLVRGQLSEIVKKKAGGGYVVYKPKDPKRDKGKPPQKAGETSNYATALEIQANNAKDKDAKERYSKRAQRARGVKTHLPKKPKTSSSGARKPKPKKTFQAEDFQRLLSTLVNERLFREESVGSEWDDYLARLSSKALEGDPKFKNLQKKIEKTTESVLADAFNAIKKSVGKGIKLQDHGIKKSDGGQTYLSFSAQLGNAVIEPIYVYAENGVPRLEMSAEAEIGITKAEPDAADLFRGRLATVQEKVLSKVKELTAAVEARDAYLEKLEVGLDDYVADLSPLQMSLLKLLLVKKYRKV
jgi:hypothetical protein